MKQSNYRIHYAWVICALAVFSMFISMGLTSNTFSIYINAFIEENGFTKAQGASLSTIRCVTSLIGTILCGKYYDKLGMRRGLSLAIGFIALSFLIYSRAHTLPVFYIGALVCGIGYGFGGMVPITMLINRWFKDKQGFVLGFASAGSGMATIVCPPIMTAGLNAGGVALAASVEGLLILAYALLMFLLLRNSPEEKGLAPYGSEPHQDSSAIPKGGVMPDTDAADAAHISEAAPATDAAHTPDASHASDAVHAADEANAPLKQPLSRRSDYLLIFAMFLVGIITAPASESLAVHMANEGLSSGVAAAAISVYGLFMTGGKFVYGTLVDMIGSYKANRIFTIVLAFGFVSAFFVSGQHPVFAFLMTAGLGAGYSMTTLGLSIWALRFYTGERANTMVRYYWVATLLGSLTFTTMPGLVADLTESYRLYYGSCVLLLLLLMGIIQRTYRRYIDL